MTQSTDKRRETMIKKYGSEEAWKAKLQEWQAKSRQTYTGGGGFRYLKEHNPDKLKTISKEAAKKRHEKEKTSGQS